MEIYMLGPLGIVVSLKCMCWPRKDRGSHESAKCGPRSILPHVSQEEPSNWNTLRGRSLYKVMTEMYDVYIFSINYVTQKTLESGTFNIFNDVFL
jgi:hypothetical protein